MAPPTKFTTPSPAPPLPPPKLRRGDLGAFGERAQLGPHDAAVDAPGERALAEAAIGAGDHVLAPDLAGEADQAAARRTR